MPSTLTRVFTDHPAAVGETYLQHMGMAARFAGLLALAAGAAVVHALVPALCKKTASNIIMRLHGEMMARR